MKKSTIIKNIAVLGSIFALSFCATFAPADHLEQSVRPFPFHEAPVPICVDKEVSVLANAHMGYVLVREAPDGAQLYRHERTGNLQIIEPSAEVLGQVCLIAAGNPELEAD